MDFIKLSDCCDIIAGQSPNSQFYNKDGIGLPFFQGKADFGDLYPEITTWCSEPIKIAEKDDILLSVRAPVGPTNLAPCKVCIGRGLSAIRPDERFLVKYVLYFFKYFEAQLQLKGTGTTFKAITQEIIKNIEIPYLPKNEQARIVSRIEELFSELDAGVETLRKTQRQLETYRISIKNKAVDTVSSEMVELSEITDTIKIGPFGTMLHKADYVDDGIPVINPQHIINGHILPNNKISVSYNKAKELEPYTLKNNDVIMGRRGEMGRTAFVTDKEAGWLCGTGSIIIRLKDEYDAEFYAHVLSGPDVVHFLEEQSTGTTMNNLNESIVKSIPVPRVTKKEQEKLKTIIADQLSFSDKIEMTLNNTIQQAESLRQSILKQAFEGKL